MDWKHMVARLRPRHIELLDALGRDPNLGRCAVQLNMSQPTSSKALREIEGIFGTPLFTRNRRGMEATPMGLVLTRRAAILMEEMRSMHQEYESTLAGGTGRIRVGVYPVVLPQLFHLWRQQMRSTWPEIVIAADEGVEHTLLAALSGGQLDCILGRVVLERLGSELRHEVLYQEPTVIVCGPQHPLARARKPQLLRWLAGSEWILPSPEGASFNLVASRLAEDGFRAPRVALEATSVYLTVEMLNADAFVSLLPLSVARGFAAVGRLHVVPVQLAASHTAVGIIVRRSTSSSPIIRGALQAARAASALMARGA